MNLHSTDVLVAGGGPAGIAAAIAASRMGAKVLLIEQMGFFGGMPTAGMVSPFQISSAKGKYIIQGIFAEVVERLKKEGMARDGALFGQTHIEFDHEWLKLVLFDMLKEAGVTFLLHTFVTGAVLQKDVLKGVATQSKSGEVKILAGVTIDCTGDGDVAAHAGAPYEKGRIQDGLMQPMTLNFRLAGVDKSRLPSRDEINAVFQSAKKEGRVSIPRETLLWFETPRPDEIHVNSSRVLHVDGTKAEDLTRAEDEGRVQMVQLFRLLKEQVAGFENSYIASSGASIGIRETRRIKGEYVLTEADVMSGQKFDDQIAVASYPIDIHDPSGPGLKWQPLPEGVYYGIPYRCLLPKKVDNLLVAGRPISVDPIAFSSTRVSPTSMALGQAAGIAAALAAKKRVSPRALKVAEIQKALRDQGANID